MDNLEAQVPGSQEGTGNDVVDMSVFDIPMSGQGISEQVNFSDGSKQPPNTELQNNVGKTEQEQQEEQLLASDPEYRARSFQSRYDRLSNEHNQIKTQSEQWRKAFDLIQEAATNPEVRKALIAELEPEVFKNTFNIDSYVEEQLKKDFGDEFVPDENDARKGYGPSFRYFERAKKLYNEAEQNGIGKVGTLKEIREKQKAETEKVNQYMQEQKQTIIQKYNASEKEIEDTIKMAQNFTLEDLFKIKRYMANSGQRQGTPNIAGIKGGEAPRRQGTIQRSNYLSSW